MCRDTLLIPVSLAYLSDWSCEKAFSEALRLCLVTSSHKSRICLLTRTGHETGSPFSISSACKRKWLNARHKPRLVDACVIHDVIYRVSFWIPGGVGRRVKEIALYSWKKSVKVFYIYMYICLYNNDNNPLSVAVRPRLQIMRLLPRQGRHSGRSSFTLPEHLLKADSQRKPIWYTHICTTINRGSQVLL